MLMPRPRSRRDFIRLSAGAVVAASVSPVQETWAEPVVSPRERIEGLLLGSLIGDALGGPVEFQDPERVRGLRWPPKSWRDDEVLDERALDAAAARLRLRSYADLRPEPEPYAHWTPEAAPGTVTDDSRHKLVLLSGLRRAEAQGAWPFDVQAMARAFLVWPDRDEIRSRYPQLVEDWLREFRYGARWVVGRAEPGKRLPPERMWNGLPTCSGQMVFPPLAAVFAGRPEEAYRATYLLAFLDNGWGRDLNAAYVAALARALVLAEPAPGMPPGPADWVPILEALRQTDPFEHAKVPWTQRSVDRWLDLAQRLSAEADYRPARLFAALDEEFRETIKWEAQVPFVVSFATLALTRYHPLAALQLSIEWGHDTDSYAQMVGALVGARYGSALFPREMRETVRGRLKLDYGEDVDELVDLLDRLRLRAARERLFPDE
jgi:ADP-ribosylglycohydrolase